MIFHRKKCLEGGSLCHPKVMFQEEFSEIIGLFA